MGNYLDRVKLATPVALSHQEAVETALQTADATFETLAASGRKSGLYMQELNRTIPVEALDDTYARSVADARHVLYGEDAGYVKGGHGGRAGMMRDAGNIRDIERSLAAHGQMASELDSTHVTQLLLAEHSASFLKTYSALMPEAATIAR